MYDPRMEGPRVRNGVIKSGVPFKTMGWEFEDLYQSDSVEQVKAWVDNVVAGKVIKASGSPLCGVGLMLQGKPGQGKTMLASVALQSVIRGIIKDPERKLSIMPTRIGTFMDYPKLLRLQKDIMDETDQDEKDMLRWIRSGIYADGPEEDQTQVFVLDDLGKEYRTASGWAENQFDALLRSRFNSGLPTIVTTNVPLKDWSSVYGEPMGSFAHEAFIPLDIKSDKGDLRL
jgi:DNA replication protein DnaC